ncbi:MAG TPA: hypothetical protein VNW06_06065, partial [Cytophagaceae bacterium]|nr:hypothetical protein [Cytophagaceae bacterium]
NVYVADQMNHRIRKICNGTVTTVAGCSQGYSNGYCTSAQFHNTTALVVDVNDNLYVVDQCNFSIRKIDPSGNVSTYSCSSQNNGSSDNQFGAPCGIAVDANCNIYVADQTNKHVKKICPNGVVSDYSCSGIENNIDATNLSCQVSVPCGLAADSKGNVYLSDYKGQCVHKITCQ